MHGPDQRRPASPVGRGQPTPRHARARRRPDALLPEGLGHGTPRSRPSVANAWARVSNDMVHRVAKLFPGHFAPVAQLPQTPDGNLSGVLAEVRRTVEDLGFVGVNLNPDLSGTWAGRPMTDASWFPVYELLEELDVPAMVHVSTACNPNFHTLGAHYLNADTSVFTQLLQGDVFRRFPGCGW
ncbi:amidohydrolase family protein [Streptomyces thermocarboxydus]